MKLSVKLLSGLAFIALVAVMIGSFIYTQATGPPIVRDASVVPIADDGLAIMELSVDVVPVKDGTVKADFGLVFDVDFAKGLISPGIHPVGELAPGADSAAIDITAVKSNAFDIGGAAAGLDPIGGALYSTDGINLGTIDPRIATTTTPSTRADNWLTVALDTTPWFTNSASGAPYNTWDTTAFQRILDPTKDLGSYVNEIVGIDLGNTIPDGGPISMTIHSDFVGGKAITTA